MRAVLLLVLLALSYTHNVRAVVEGSLEPKGMELNDSPPPKTTASVLEDVTQQGTSGVHDVKTKQGVAESVTPVDDAKGATVTAQRVANTLNGLGHVLQSMYKQVEADEHMFKSFKEQVLEDEVAKSNIDLSWPAIKDLVKSEVSIGRQNLANQLAQFKVDVLDVVQKGLDALRTDLRATVTAGYVAKTSVAPADTHSVDEDEHLPKPSTTASVDRFLSTLDAPEPIKKDIEAYVKHKLSPESLSAKLDDYGMNAMGALREMESALRGKLSSKDLRSEIFSRLEDLTKDYLKNPSPSAKAALEALKSSLLQSLTQLKDKAAEAQAAADLPVKADESQVEEKAAEKEKKELVKEKEETKKIGDSVQSALQKRNSETAADNAVAAAEKVLAEESKTLADNGKLTDAHNEIKKGAAFISEQVKRERLVPAMLEENADILPLP